MSQMAKMRSYKYLNQLAQSQQNSRIEAQEEYLKDSVRWRLKSVNQFALSDPCFFPHLPHYKSKTCSTFNSSLKRTSKLSLRSVMNPEGEELEDRSSKQQMNHFAYDQKIERENIDQKKSKTIADGHSRSYCFDCDEVVQWSQDHICPCHFTVLQSINKILQDLSILIASNQCEKLMILSDSSCKINESSQMTMLISFLKHNSVYYNSFELFLRKRLINLSCKKLALLLESEDKQ